MSSVDFEPFRFQREPRFGSSFGAAQLVTRKVAAAMIGVDNKTLDAMRRQRRIESVRTASGEFRFLETEINAYLSRER